jgi:uncharacterized repeat protein (TIGR03803 family)
MNRIRLAKIACVVALFCAMNVSVALAQTFTTIANLRSVDYQVEGLIPANDGKLLGFDHGAPSSAIIEAGLNGGLAEVYTFCSLANCADGYFPQGIFQAADGTIYGTTQGGGANSKGALYELSLDGKETVLYSFCAQSNCADGWSPYSAPAPSLQGGVIGTTFAGGVQGKGILYELSPAGKFTRLYSFCAQTNCTDGAGPVTSPFQAADGTIYGTTNLGGALGFGSVYSFASEGGLVTLYSFAAGAGGSSAEPTLIQGADGNFYGVTLFLGQAGNGSIFKLTPQGKFTTLYSFCTANTGNCADGAGPIGLIQGSDGNLYGMTSVAGSFGGGTIFEITPKGALTTLYSFCSQAQCMDGNGPQSLMQDTNGMLYGTTAAGGAHDHGTAFSLSVGLKPFVQANPGWGKVGALVGILGSNLTGTTSVTFNGTAATFKVVSNAYIEAEVPTGATSGLIQVATPCGTLNSNFSFQLLP